MSDKKDTSLGRHLFNIFISCLVILIPTGPLVSWLFPDWAFRTYLILILPGIGIVAYMVYLSYLDDRDKKKDAATSPKDKY